MQSGCFLKTVPGTNSVSIESGGTVWKFTPPKTSDSIESKRVKGLQNGLVIDKNALF